MELEGYVHQYEWGKIGNDGTVAKIATLNNPQFTVQTDKPYAELWMGTHPNGPSKLKGSTKTLADVIAENPTYVGANVTAQFGNQLPFLFKILSINKALSIQVHPNKSHAEKLFATRPDLYKDPNHKPELAIALTPFEALCGFQPLEKIMHNISNIPELQVVIGTERVEKFKSSLNKNTLKSCFEGLMKCDANQITEQLTALLARVKTLDENTRIEMNAGVLEKLAQQYPGDVGCFTLYFMNYLELAVGEAIFLEANELHAYISGDCIECMACSDNVVRAGLTPKFKDVDTLCSMLTYSSSEASAKKFQPILEDACSAIFKPPVPDFGVVKIQIPASIGSYQLRTRTTASILVVISGEGKMGKQLLSPGVILFIPTHTATTVEGNNDLLMFQAIANV